MKKLLLFAMVISAGIFSCSKDSNDMAPDNNRTLQIKVQDYQPPSIGNRYWGIYFVFNPQVTLNCSAKVDYDVYDRNALYKHYSYKINFTLTNGNTFVYNTQESSGLIGPEIRNLLIDSLSTTGDYNITLIK